MTDHGLREALDELTAWAHRNTVLIDAQDPQEEFVHTVDLIYKLDALRAKSNHRPHDQLGEPIEGFPVCSVCGATPTDLPALGPDGYPVDEMGG